MIKFDKRFSKIYSSKSCSDFTRSVQKSKEKPTKHEYDKVKKAYTELGGRDFPDISSFKNEADMYRFHKNFINNLI